MSTTKLQVLIAGLALLVMALGALVLLVRLRPEDPLSERANRDLTIWEDIVAREPNSSQAHDGYGLALAQSGRAADALEEFRTAVRLDGKNYRALYHLGSSVKEEDPERAIGLLRKAGRLAPGSQRVGPFVELGALLREEGRLQEALRAYKSAVADAPFILEARAGLAETLEDLGRPEEALEHYQAALAFSPGNRKLEDAIERLTGTSGRGRDQ